jgi:hypothetical protein
MPTEELHWICCKCSRGGQLTAVIGESPRELLEAMRRKHAVRSPKCRAEDSHLQIVDTSPQG